MEMTPPRSLSKLFNKFWLSENTTDSDIHFRILPDCCSDIILPLSGDGINPLFIGSMSTYHDTVVKPGGKLLGLRFNPGYSYNLIDTNMKETINNIYDLTTLCDLDFLPIFECFKEDKELKSSVLESIFSPIRPKDNSFYRIEKALNTIYKNNGLLKIEDLALKLNISTRYLEKEFLKVVGFTPKKYSRIVRFTKNLELYHKSRQLYGIGYHDQSHLIKDFKEFTGQTPGHFLQSSHFYNTNTN